MTNRAMARRSRILLGVLLGLIVGFLLICPAIAQPTTYHEFADQRTIFGLPHAINVLSNFPFLVIGAWGLWLVVRDRGSGLPLRTREERWPWLVFFLGVTFTSAGSAYYHLDPNNGRLVWDRLPITVAFMALFAAILGETFGVRFGLLLLGPSLVLGMGSVAYWNWTETLGRGDLRPYLVIQFTPLLCIPFLLAFFPANYTRRVDYLVALGWYVVAKFCEAPLDGPIYNWTGWVSGHTLKHLAAAMGTYWVLRMLRKRRPLQVTWTTAPVS